MKNIKERFFYLDLIRVIACMMVVLMHAPMPSKNAVGIFAVGISYFTMPCIGLFFAVSGSLLLPIHNPPAESPNELVWIRRRLGKILCPAIFGSIIYILANQIFKVTQSSNQIPSTIKSLCSIPFSVQGHGVLWFMYTH